MHAPNLYQHFGVSPSENSTALGVLLAGQDAALSEKGLSMTSDVRKQTMIAYAVLSDDHRRELYDAALLAGRPVGWGQLEYLGNFDAWPEEYLGWTEPEPATGPAAAQQGRPYAVKEPQASPYNNPFDPLIDPRMNAVAPVFGRMTGGIDYAAQQHRPAMGTRFWVAFLDGIVAMFASAALVMLLGLGKYETFELVLWLAFMVVYFIVPEVMWGGSPMKLAAGYEVRDVETGERLDYTQSLKRNWFRLVQIIPGVGQMIGGIGAAVCLFSITPENGQRGLHDRAANAEVVKKQRR